MWRFALNSSHFVLSEHMLSLLFRSYNGLVVYVCCTLERLSNEGFCLQMLFPSARKNTSYVGREVPVSHASIPRSLPRDRTTQRHTVSPTKTVLPSVSNVENLSYSAADNGKSDQLAVDKMLSLSDADDGVCRKNVTVMVCSDSMLPDKQPSKSDSVDSLTEVCVHQSDDKVADMATEPVVDSVPHEYSSTVSAVISSDFCDDNVKDAGHSESACEVCPVVSENILICDAEVSVDQSELLDSVSDEHNLLPAVSEAAVKTAVLAVSCEDRDVFEAHLPPVIEHSVIDTTVKLCSVTEEVSAVESVADMAEESNCHNLMEAAVLSYIPEELTVCTTADAPENRPCLTDGEELLITHPAEQIDEALSSCLPSNMTVCSDDNNAPVISPTADAAEQLQSVNGGSLEALDSSQSVVDICLPERLLSRNAQSSPGSFNWTETCTADTHQLPADLQVDKSSSTEKDVQDKDITTTSDQHEHVGFTIGESFIADGIFRRCSMDSSGRGIVLSRIVEESAAGLAAVSGEGDQTHLHDGEQHVTAGELSVCCSCRENSYHSSHLM